MVTGTRKERVWREGFLRERKCPPFKGIPLVQGNFGREEPGKCVPWPPPFNLSNRCPIVWSQLKDGRHKDPLLESIWVKLSWKTAGKRRVERGSARAEREDTEHSVIVMESLSTGNFLAFFLAELSALSILAVKEPFLFLGSPSM